MSSSCTDVSSVVTKATPIPRAVHLASVRDNPGGRRRTPGRGRFFQAQPSMLPRTRPPPPPAHAAIAAEVEAVAASPASPTSTPRRSPRPSTPPTLRACSSTVPPSSRFYGAAVRQRASRWPRTTGRGRSPNQPTRATCPSRSTATRRATAVFHTLASCHGELAEEGVKVTILDTTGKVLATRPPGPDQRLRRVLAAQARRGHHHAQAAGQRHRRLSPHRRQRHLRRTLRLA